MKQPAPLVEFTAATMHRRRVPAPTRKLQERSSGSPRGSRGPSAQSAACRAPVRNRRCLKTRPRCKDRHAAGDRRHAAGDQRRSPAPKPAASGAPTSAPLSFVLPQLHLDPPPPWACDFSLRLQAVEQRRRWRRRRRWRSKSAGMRAKALVTSSCAHDVLAQLQSDSRRRAEPNPKRHKAAANETNWRHVQQDETDRRVAWL